MHADRQARLAGRLVDRPVAAAAHQVRGAGEHQHVGEAAVARAAADFFARGVRIFVRHDQRSLEPRIERVPMIDLELVGGERQRGGELVVLLALPRRRQRIHHAILDAIEIEVLLAHELIIAGRQPAVRRPRVAPRRQRLALRIGKALDVAVVRARAVGHRIVPPAIAQIRPQIFQRTLRMNVAVDDLQLGFGAAIDLPGFNVHGASSLGSGSKSFVAL